MTVITGITIVIVFVVISAVSIINIIITVISHHCCYYTKPSPGVLRLSSEVGLPQGRQNPGEGLHVGIQGSTSADGQNPALPIIRNIP